MAGEKIRVLIVDDVAETRENVRKLLQFETDVEVAGTARTGKEGIQLAGELDPDVILMDINMPDVDGITATEQIRLKMPHIQVVILSVQGDQNYMRRAMLAGARDFLTKPPMGDELISAVRRSGEMARSERAKSSAGRANQGTLSSTMTPLATMNVSLTRGKVVTVYSPKGGTGCTTVAVNLALALHNDDTRAAIVDGNLQYGDVAIFFNEQGKNTIADLAPRADELELEIVEGVLLKHAVSGVHILAAPTRLEQAEKVSADQFTKVVEYLRTLYAYIVVDVSGPLSEIAIAAIDLSDAIVLLTTQDIPAVKNARQFLDVLQTLGVNRECIVFTMNRYDKRIPITPERVGENLKQEVAAVIPLDERAAIPAVNQGVPFMINNKTLPAARGIYSLAEVVRARISAREEPADRPVKR